MPSRKPRVALTLPDDLNDTLEQLSEIQGIPKTKLITELLVDFHPVFKQSLDALLKIQSDRDNATNIAKNFAADMILNAADLMGDLAKEVKKG